MNDAPGRIMATASLSGTDASAAIDCTRYQLVGIYTPGTLTSTAITFQASADNSTFVTVMEVGGAATYSVTVSTSDYVPLDPRVFAGAQYVKLVPGSSEASARSITCVLRPVS
jgi:hypothetical protein